MMSPFQMVMVVVAGIKMDEPNQQRPKALVYRIKETREL